MKNKLLAKNISKSFLNKDRTIRIINNLNFLAQSGGITTILGPSGCGKTTLLKMVGDIIKPDEGAILFNNEDISLLRQEHKIGWIPQFPTLLKNRTVEQNIKLPLEIIGLKTSIKKVVNLVGLNGKENKYPSQLSGGMKQRVSLAQCLVYSPQLLLMDEPFSALDEITREEMQLEVLRLANKFEPTIIFVTHNIEEAVFISDRIILLSKKGSLVKNFKILRGGLTNTDFRSSMRFFYYTDKIRKIFKLL